LFLHFPTIDTGDSPLLFLLYINDLPDNLESSCRLFADDCLVYKDITTTADVHILQKDLQRLEKWQNKWLMCFNPKKCSTITFGSWNPPRREYKFCGETLAVEETTTYLGVQLSNNLTWNHHTQHAVSKAQKILGLVKRNLWSCPERVKVTAYQTLVRPHLEYATAAWCPYKQKNCKSIERVQRQAARFCRGNYNREVGTVTKILQELNWTSLEDRRTIHRLTIMFKIAKGLIDIPLDERLRRNTRLTRGHNLKYVECATRLDIYRNSFYPRTIKQWNRLPADVVNAESPQVFKTRLEQYTKKSTKSFK
jgi:hypothetical protein